MKRTMALVGSNSAGNLRLILEVKERYLHLVNENGI